MDMITVEVVRKFRDAHTGAIYAPGATFEVTSERLAEIMAVNVHLVRVVEKNDGENDSDDETETSAPNGEDAETSDDETETSAPNGEDAETSDDETETSAPEGEDAETGGDAAETSAPEGEDKPKARRGRKPANNN